MQIVDPPAYPRPAGEVEMTLPVPPHSALHLQGPLGPRQIPPRMLRD